MDATYLRTKFEQALPYERYVETGKPEHQEKWNEVYNRVRLTDAQSAVVGGFQRRVNALVNSGTWCGDCVAQCPMIQRICEANPELVVARFLDRDEHADLSERIAINTGLRVPTVVFLAEDFEFVHMLGDRTLTRYRAIAAQNLGASCPLPGAPIPDDELAGTVQDWVDEFERVHLLLRLSPRLRETHQD